MRVGAAYTQTGVLAKGRAKGFAVRSWSLELGAKKFHEQRTTGPLLFESAPTPPSAGFNVTFEDVHVRALPEAFHVSRLHLALLLPPKKVASNHKSPLFCSSFLPLTRSSQSSVCLVSPSCFWAGETWGGKWGTESDSATNSAGERLRSEPAGACGLWLQGMLAPGRQRSQAKLNDHQGPATIFKNKGMGYSKHCAQGMLNTRVLPLHS
jgi:hypothetical protein